MEAHAKLLDLKLTLTEFVDLQNSKLSDLNYVVSPFCKPRDVKKSLVKNLKALMKP